MRIQALLIALAALMLVTSGCRPGALVVADDDDAGDDDATGDDDTADDDTADDDTADDDDDDTADDDDDDDTADDDDDDTADDDDDDDSIPPTPGLWFTVPSGDMAGDYAFETEISCGPTQEGPGIWAAMDWSWDEAFVIGFDGPPPDANEHTTQLWMYWWWDGWHGGNAWGEGSASCFLDTVDPFPATTGTFECDAMWYQDQGVHFWFEIVDGMVRCP